MVYDLERNMEARDARRGKAEDRFLSRMEKREAEAEKLVGELCREGVTIYYINERRKDGTLTGHIREFTESYLAVAFLLRNHYA